MELLQLDYINQDKNQLDCCLKINEHEIFVHKCIIQRCSEYFNNQFTKKKKIFTFDDDFQYHIIKIVIDLLYNCIILDDVNMEYLTDIYIFVDKYVITYLKENIVIFIINNFESLTKKDHNIIIDLFKFTKDYDSIYKIIQKYIVNNNTDFEINFFITFNEYSILKNKFDDLTIQKLYENKYISVLSYLNYKIEFNSEEYQLVELDDNIIIHNIFKKIHSLDTLKNIISVLKSNTHHIIKNTINELFLNNIICLHYYLSFHLKINLDDKLDDTELIKITLDYLEEKDQGHLVASIIIHICKKFLVTILPNLDEYKNGLKAIKRWYSYIESERIYIILYENNKLSEITYLNRRNN